MVLKNSVEKHKRFRKFHITFNLHEITLSEEYKTIPLYIQILLTYETVLVSGNIKEREVRHAYQIVN